MPKDTDFDDISELLNDVLEDKVPEVAAPPPEEQKTIEVPIAAPEDNILGDFLNEIAEETVSESLSPPATKPAESVPAKSDPISDIEDVLADLTGDLDMPVEGVTQAEATGEAPPTDSASQNQDAQVEAVGVGGDLTQVCKEHVFADTVEATVIKLPTFCDDELADSIDIRNFATLVTLNCQRWHAKVKDNKAAKDAADKAGASPEAFEARKRLLAGCDDELKAVHKEIDTARTEHYRLTMPWSTVGINDVGKRAGGRLMPNTLFLEYTTTMAKCKANMEAKLALFETKYPSLIAIAQQKLGTAFNPAEYPNPSSIRQHFNLSFDFHPIPIGEDFKGLQQAQTEQLSAALKRKTRIMLENAMQDVWKTLYETVQHAHAKLSTPGAMFQGSLIEKLRDQSKLMGHLNATMDKNIAQVANLISGDLIKYDPKDIRKDDALRKRLADYAGKIVKFMEGVANA